MSKTINKLVMYKVSCATNVTQIMLNFDYKMSYILYFLVFQPSSFSGSGTAACTAATRGRFQRSRQSGCDFGSSGGHRPASLPEDVPARVSPKYLSKL